MIKDSSNTKVLFLGEKDCSLISWLEDNGEKILQTTEKISPDLILLNNIDIVVSFGYRHILKKNILDLLPNKFFNLHISFLPWNRGADPNFWSFYDQTPKGVSIHLIDEGIDTGDIISQREIEFDLNTETLASSYIKLHSSLKELFIENWSDIKNESYSRVKQFGQGSTHKLQDKKSLSFTYKDCWDKPVNVLTQNKKN